MNLSIFKPACRLMLLALACAGTSPVVAQTSKDADRVDLSVRLTDRNNLPVKAGLVSSANGKILARADRNGLATFTAATHEEIRVSAPGYRHQTVSADHLSRTKSVALSEEEPVSKDNELIGLPYLQLERKRVTGSVYKLDGEQLERYPSSDLRNALTGLVPGLRITELNGAPGMTAEEKLSIYGITEKIEVSSRGFDMMYLIDGIPVDITEIPLDPQEIASVAVIRDIVGKAMFGPAAANGIISITTRRGSANRRQLRVNVESGTSIIDRMPEWVSGADYARLNNQARENSGRPSAYTDAQIRGFEKNDPYDFYTPNVNYRELMLKNSKSFNRASLLLSSGDERVQYSAYLGYTGEGDIFKIGAKSDYNRLNGRSNIDVKFSEVLKLRFDIFAGLSFRRAPNYGYTVNESSANMRLLEFNSAINDITNTPPVEFPVYANNSPELKSPWFGVSSRYTTNPVGNLIRNGYYTETGRTGTVNAVLDFNLKSVLPGLTSRTSVSYDALNLMRIGKAINYIGYNVIPSKTTDGRDTVLLTKRNDGVDTPNLSNLHDYYYQRINFSETLGYKKSSGSSVFETGLTYYINLLTRNGVKQPQRLQTLVWNGNYSYADKYVLHAVLNYSGSSSFDKGKRFALFPSVGAGWVVSKEAFLSDAKSLDHLKLRAEAGVLGNEYFLAPFYYRSSWSAATGGNFGPFSLNQWFGNNVETAVARTLPARTGNPDLTWEKRKEVSVGIESVWFGNKLFLDVNYFNVLRTGQITQLINSLPLISGVSNVTPLANYNNTRYQGWEIGLRYAGNAKDFRYSFGGNLGTLKTKLIKYDEPVFRNSYQSRIGTGIDTYWGQTYLGKFASDAETKQVPQLYDEALREGDLKYKDMNGDNVVDDNDISAIGHSMPRLSYALHVNLGYKNFDLTLLGTGAAFFDIARTNKYFWNGWGDNNYSRFVKDNIGGDYPRLTYEKVNNNFLMSDFWLTRGDFFKVQNAELAYTIQSDKLDVIGSKSIRIFVRGANLLTISKVKDVDPESINSGVTVYPLFRTFTGGLKVVF